MDSVVYSKMLHAPTYAGASGEPPTNGLRESTGSGNAFRELLEQKIGEGSQMSFSKHTIGCMVGRGVDVSSEGIERLNEGIRMAEERNSKEPLVPLGSAAFVIDVRNSKVVTVVNEDSLKGAIFTNIDGTVTTQPVLLETILAPDDGRAGRLERED